MSIAGRSHPRRSCADAPVDAGASLQRADAGRVRPPASAADVARARARRRRGASATGACFVVDRRWEPSARHGRERDRRAGASGCDRAAGEAPLFAGGAPARPPFVFFDLETTGLSGGAGTLRVPRRLRLVRRGRRVRDAAVPARRATRTSARCSRRSPRSSRAPARSSPSTASRSTCRCSRRAISFTGCRGAARELPHVDMLHPARRFWRARERLEHAPGAQERGCSLGALERQLLGVAARRRRAGLRDSRRATSSSCAAATRGRSQPVLEHNRLDLLSLAGADGARCCTWRGRARTLPRRRARRWRSAASTSAPGSTIARAARYRRAVGAADAPRGASTPIADRRAARAGARAAAARGGTTRRRRAGGELLDDARLPGRRSRREADRGARDPPRAPRARSRGGARRSRCGVWRAGTRAGVDRRRAPPAGAARAEDGRGEA